MKSLLPLLLAFLLAGCGKKDPPKDADKTAVKEDKKFKDEDKKKKDKPKVALTPDPTPKGFRDDIPIYPGSREFDSRDDGAYAAWNIPDKISAIYSFYDHHLRQREWKILEKMRNGEERAEFRAEQGEETLALTLIAKGKETEATVQVTRKEAPKKPRETVVFGLPADFPDDMPLFKGMKVNIKPFGKDPMKMTFKTDLPVDKAKNLTELKLRDHGWKVLDRADLDTGYSIYAVKEDRGLTIQLDEGDADTLISMELGKKKAEKKEEAKGKKDKNGTEKDAPDKDKEKDKEKK